MSRPTQLRLAALAAFSGLVVLLRGGISAAASLSTTLAPAAESRSFVPGELIVRFMPGSRAAARAAVLSIQGVNVERELRLPGTKLVRVPQGRSVTAAAAALERPEVLYAEPNRIYQTSATPNDPRFPELWGLSQASDADIDAPEAGDLQTGSSNVIGAVVDSVIAYDHPDIAPNRWVNDDPPGGGDNDGDGFVDDAAFPAGTGGGGPLRRPEGEGEDAPAGPHAAQVEALRDRPSEAHVLRQDKEGQDHQPGTAPRCPAPARNPPQRPDQPRPQTVGPLW
jgi:hypothetical protein